MELQAIKETVQAVRMHYQYRLYLDGMDGDTRSDRGNPREGADPGGTADTRDDGMTADLLEQLEDTVERLKERYHYRLYQSLLQADGGPGSGNWGHAGRKGLRGGSTGGSGGKMNRIAVTGGGFTSAAKQKAAAKAEAKKKAGQEPILASAASSPADTPTRKVKTPRGDFGGATPREMCKALDEAKASRPDEDRFRVTNYSSPEEFMKEHPGAICHITKGGSTCAVTPDGDIVAVCKNKKDHTIYGDELLDMAVKAGGIKLDSYDGNHDFYNGHGFTPVSWCKWDDGAADEKWLNDDWRKANNLPEDITTAQLSAIPDSTLKYKREDVVFYKYTGSATKEISLKDFKKKVPPSPDYDAAKDARELSLRQEGD